MCSYMRGFVGRRGQRAHDGVEEQLAKVVDIVAQQRRQRDVHRQ